MIAEQLKKSILQAAIQGKLTQQLPEDGDARDLLKEIRKEKARLIKEGKIKKEKPLPEITEDEISFEIPENWCWVRLGEIVLQNLGGGTPSKSNPDYWDGGIPWASVKDLNCKFLDSTKDNISQDGLDNSSSNLIPAGNLIVCTRMGLGKVVYNRIDVAINQDLRVIILSENMSKWYVYYFYLTLNFSGKGATVKGISVESLSNTLLPLPPLKEQKRIVERIEELLPEIESLKNDETKLEELQKSFPKKMKDAILQYAIQGKLTQQLPEDGDARDLLKEIQKEKTRLIKEGKIKKEKPLPEITEDEIPFEIPENWCWLRLGNLCEYLQRGKSPIYSPIKKYPVIAQKCNQWEGFSIEKAQFIDPATVEKYAEERILKNEDLMWNSTGLGTLGRIAIYEDSKNPYGFAVADSHVTVIRMLKNYVCPLYIFVYLSGPYIQSIVEDLSSGSTKQKELLTSTIEKIIIPLPPMEEQKRILSRLKELIPLSEKVSN